MMDRNFSSVIFSVSQVPNLLQPGVEHINIRNLFLTIDKISTSTAPAPLMMPSPRFSLANSLTLLSLIVNSFLSSVLSPHISKAVDSELVGDQALVKLSVPGSDKSYIILEDLSPQLLLGWKYR